VTAPGSSSATDRTGRRYRPRDPGAGKEHQMRVTGYSSGSIRVDSLTQDRDLVIDRGQIRKRTKAASRKFVLRPPGLVIAAR
jgi:hypothetical protein